MVILKEALPKFFKADEVMVRFGLDPVIVPVFWKSDKILKGETSAGIWEAVFNRHFLFYGNAYFS